MPELNRFETTYCMTVRAIVADVVCQIIVEEGAYFDSEGFVCRLNFKSIGSVRSGFKAADNHAAAFLPEALDALEPEAA